VAHHGWSTDLGLFHRSRVSDDAEGELASILPSNLREGLARLFIIAGDVCDEDCLIYILELGEGLSGHIRDFGTLIPFDEVDHS